MSFGFGSATEKERSRQYALIWAGAFGGAFSVANLFIGIDHPFLCGLAFGATAGGPMAFSLNSRYDEYLRSLLDVGAKWLCIALGLYLLWGGFSSITDLPDVTDLELAHLHLVTAKMAVTENVIVSLFLCMTFYCGFAFAWLRDKISG